MKCVAQLGLDFSSKSLELLSVQFNKKGNQCNPTVNAGNGTFHLHMFVIDCGNRRTEQMY